MELLVGGALIRLPLVFSLLNGHCFSNTLRIAFSILTPPDRKGGAEVKEEELVAGTSGRLLLLHQLRTDQTRPFNKWLTEHCP